MTSERTTNDDAAPRPGKQWSVQRLGRVRPAGEGAPAERPPADVQATDSRLQASAEARSPQPEARSATIADVGVAQVDLDRVRRCGFPEVVFGQGKAPETIEKIFTALLASGTEAFATRIDPAQAEYLRAKFASGRYNAVARTFRVPACQESGDGSQETILLPPASCPLPPGSGRVTIVTAGTSDLPVAEEARETALWMGVDVTLICDVGVAGPQRLLAHLDEIQSADAVVVVAGMEGALPSVVGGHVACPVIAVPTSVGYGASLGGIAALLAMLNSCAANVTVVNIDGGFKGGYLAGMIARRLAEARSGISPARKTVPAR
jgi:NCAIR mutase (PurE)-related protein